MKHLLTGAALLGAATWLGRRRYSLGSVLTFEHPVIRLANEYLLHAQGVEHTTLFGDREANPENCAQEKRDLVKVKRLRMRLDAKVRGLYRSLTDDDDRLYGTVLWSMNRMDLGDTSLKHAEQNYRFNCEGQPRPRRRYRIVKKPTP